MTYLKYLEQTLNTPVTNYHECILSKRGKEINRLSFFNLDSVQKAWSDISILEKEIYSLERINKRRVPDHFLSSDNKGSRNGKSTSSRNDDVESRSLTYLYSKIKSSKEGYAHLKSKYNFTENIESKSYSQVEPVQQVKRPDKEASVEESSSEYRSFDSGTSGVDFLLSVAGMFSSGTSDKTPSDEDDIADMILRKHGMDR